MRSWGLLTVMLAACYRAPATDDPCAISCTTSCPSGLSCQDGFCVEPGGSCHPTFTSVSAGADFACAIDVRADLWCWGDNAHGQIAPASQLQFPRPTVRDRTHIWTLIDAGTGHACGIADGTLFCWGQNDHGEVSATVAGDVVEPLAITFSGAPSSWSTVAAGAEYTCAIGDGTLYCWGSNDTGQLGDGTATDHGVPTPISDPASGPIHDWVAVATGVTHTCAVSATQGVFCWGFNNLLQLGPNITTSSPVPVQASSIIATSIAVTRLSTCMTTPDLQLVCWGDNQFGELGDQAMTMGVPFTGTPTMASALTGWTEVSGGELMLCGVRAGDLACWGNATNGGLGDGAWTETGFHAIGTATQVSVGFGLDLDPAFGDHGDRDLACSLASGVLACWGDDRFGQLGTGGATMAIAPAEVAGAHLFSAFSLGRDHGCGIEGTSVFCWGSALDGATTGQDFGDPTARCTPELCDLGTPKPILFAAGATELAAGDEHTCALQPPMISCWGANFDQQLGTNDAPPHQRDVPSPIGQAWTHLIDTGEDGQCARMAPADATFCWGSVLHIGLPAAEPELDGVKAIALGRATSCFVDATGALACLGDDTNGEFGNGDLGTCGDGVCAYNEGTATCAQDCPDSTNTCGDTLCTFAETCQVCPGDCGACSPSQLTSLRRAYTALVSSPLDWWCGLRADQVVECWGTNTRGQTGAAPSAFMSQPFALPLAGCSAVAAGSQHACAICGGTISCWGDNRLAQLGVGPPSQDPSSNPRAITLALDGDPWVRLVAAGEITCALSQAGHAYCWGTNFHAALGNGATSANLPVPIH